MQYWRAHTPRVMDYLGFIPKLIDINLLDVPVKEQIASNYAHGGGYSPYGEGKHSFDPATMILTFPGDPPFEPMASAETVNGEKIIVYVAGIVCIVQPDGTFAVTRMD